MMIITISYRYMTLEHTHGDRFHRNEFQQMGTTAMYPPEDHAPAFAPSSEGLEVPTSGSTSPSDAICFTVLGLPDTSSLAVQGCTKFQPRQVVVAQEATVLCTMRLNRVREFANIGPKIGR